MKLCDDECIKTHKKQFNKMTTERQKMYFIDLINYI